MVYLISVYFFFENSLRRQKFFEYFIEYYKDELKLPDTKRKQITENKMGWKIPRLRYVLYFI